MTELSTRFIVGCMTGTSLDGLDVALVHIRGEGLDVQPKFIDMASKPLGSLRDELAYFASGQAAQPVRYLRAARRLGILHAQTVEQLLEQHPHVTADFVTAHGQTIWHAPDEQLSWQLFDPWPIVRRLKLPVLYDLRQADLVAGGQGAPITPLADWIIWKKHERTAIVNLGGVCNITTIGTRGPADVRGLDIGPCNLLIDGVVQRLYPSMRFDKEGKIAARGTPTPLIGELLSQNPFWNRPGKRTTGREDFGDTFLDWLVEQAKQRLSNEDIVASAVEAVVQQVEAWRSTQGVEPFVVENMVLSGGGGRNRTLVQRLRDLCADVGYLRCKLSDELGVPCEAREAMGFAVLGALTQDGFPITLPLVTGAKDPGCAGVWARP